MKKCSSLEHIFEGRAEIGKKCLCGSMKMEKTGIKGKNGNDMARVVPVETSFQAVIDRAVMRHISEARQ